MTQPGCTKMAISQLLLHVASSNLVGRTSKWCFIIKFSLLLSIILCWREIRPDPGKTNENKFVQVFSQLTTQRSGFRQSSCVVDEQACVFSSCAFNKHSVLKIFTIGGQNFLCNLQAYNFARPSAKSKSFCTILNIPVLSTASNFQGSIFST